MTEKQYKLSEEQRAKRRKWNADWNEKNRERHLEIRKKAAAKYSRSPQGKATSASASKTHMLKTKYQMTKEDLDAMFERCNSQCEICSKELDREKQKYAIDHSHATGQVRGLLCKNCNVGLGMFKDNPQVIRAAIEFLKAEQGAQQ